MNEFVYKDYLPANARVIINYKAKEKVKFSYPRKWTYWKAVWKCAYPTIASFWAKIHTIPAFYFALYFIFPYVIISAIYYFLNNIPISKENITLIIILPGMLLYFFAIPVIFTFFLALNKERLSNMMPKFGYWVSSLNFSKKEIIFTKKDIINNKAIIPEFSNVFLDYKCFGDFDKYIKKIEILEIPFNYKHRSILFPFLKKKEKNDFSFRAVFYFSNKPTNGKMIVNFI